MFSFVGHCDGRSVKCFSTVFPAVFPPTTATDLSGVMKDSYILYPIFQHQIFIKPNARARPKRLSTDGMSTCSIYHTNIQKFEKYE